MAKDNDQKQQLHIALFPWLAFGHMIPFLELAKLIAQKGHKISFISTPRNIDRLPKIPSHLSPLINFVKLPLPPTQNLLPGAEATSDVPMEDVCFLENAYDSLQQPLTHFLQSSLPDWILFDFSSYWLPSIAQKLNIPNSFFSIFTACCISFTAPPLGGDEYRRKVEDYTVAPSWVPFASTACFRHFEAVKCFPALDENNKSIITVFYRFRESMRRSDIISIRSCIELESDWLTLLEQLHQKPVVPVGVLTAQANEAEKDSSEAWKSIKLWLDKQDKGSVVYIAFGSEAKPTQEELTEIALGLELSELPFFWVLRKRRGMADTDVIELPEGFEERTKGRGIVCTGWAPQLQILGHESVGGFLAHSGWSSVVEALQFARPLVFLTFYADQGLNSKLFQEKKIGYLIPRREEDGWFSRKSVAESLRLVVVEDEGKFYRDRAMDLSGLFGDKVRQELYIDEFLDQLETQRFLIKNRIKC